MSQLQSVIPLIALALLVRHVLSRVRGDIGEQGLEHPSTFCWVAVPGVALIASSIWCLAGLYTGGPVGILALCAASLLCVHVVLDRRRLAENLRARVQCTRLPERLRGVVIPVAALLVCTVLGFLAVELPYNSYVPWMSPGCVAIQAALILGTLAFLYFLFQRRGVGIAIGVGACFLIGLAQFFVASFKSAAILPNDLFVLGTAAAVSGSYVYSVGDWVLLGLACLVLAVGICSLVIPPVAQPGARARRTAANLAAAALAFAALWAGVTLPSYFDDLGVGMEYWYSLDYYRKQGLITTFVAVAQDLPIDVPEGYTENGARELEGSYASSYDGTLGSTPEHAAAQEQFAQEQPSVICIMNETFSDLTVLDGESWGYEGPRRYRAMVDTLSDGTLNVSVIGGGTCNSEFEFLTGVSLAYVGDGKYPYSLYDLSEAPSLARQFSELGYETTAMHPNYASNWNRDRVYEALGFDEFLDIEDFEGAEEFHSGVSDEETYDKVLEVLASSDKPQFVFDVTMQNHSGYNQKNIGRVDQYEVDGVSDYDNARLSEYLGCIDESDRALAEFLDELRELNRPVVVIFFGDHQPALSSIVNDALYASEEDELAHNLRTHETTYFIWANYDVAGNAQKGEKDETSPAYLGAMLAEAIGAPLTNFQKAQLVAREEMPAVSLLGALDSSGTWCALDDEVNRPGVYDDLAQISYLEFVSKLE